jgi:hypothetical protein
LLTAADGYSVPAAVAVDDVQYHAMLLRARELRRLVDDLGSLSAPEVDASVLARLVGKPVADGLPPGQIKLVDEIVELLQRPGLSALQARGLAHAFRSK